MENTLRIPVANNIMLMLNSHTFRNTVFFHNEHICETGCDN